MRDGNAHRMKRLNKGGNTMAFASIICYIGIISFVLFAIIQPLCKDTDGEQYGVKK